PTTTTYIYSLSLHDALPIFLQVAQHLQQCKCYLGNDSGLTHLAAMLGVPTVAIFSPTDPKIWRPVGPFVNVIQGYSLENITVDEDRKSTRLNSSHEWISYAV